ncbi:hypothetical protein D3C73_946370 [compost metagenome]
MEGTVEPHDPVARGYCGIRLLRAPAGGLLRSLPDIEALAGELNIQLVEAVYSKRLSDSVTALVKDNTSFIGHIVLFDEHYAALSANLLRLAEAIESRVEITTLAAPARAVG